MARDLNQAPYEAQWRRYRQVQRLTFGLLLGWLPYGALVLTLTGRFGSDALTFGLIAPWALALMISMVCAGNLRCPRCGKRFFRKRRAGSRWTSECLHCRLPKWAGSLRHPLKSRT
jgi:hypothetical protein